MMIKSGHGLIFCFKVSRNTDSTMISAKESQDFLESIPIFAGLETSALALIADAVEQTFFHAGETIVGEAEAGNRMFIVQTGRVEVVKNLGTMRETALAVLGPKEFFGEMCIIECLTRCASVRAIEDTLFICAEKHRSPPALRAAARPVRHPHIEHRTRYIPPLARP